MATGVRECFFFVKENVSSNWKDLAYHLGFEQADIENIESKHGDDKSHCMVLLEEWLKRNGERATIEVLMAALSEANLQSVADGVNRNYPGMHDPHTVLPVHLHLGLGHQPTAEVQQMSAMVPTQQQPFGAQQQVTWVQQPPAEAQQTFSGMKHEYAGVQQQYAGVQQAYSGVQQAYSGVQQPYSGVQQPYSGVQQTYAGLQQPSDGVQQQPIYGMQQQPLYGIQPQPFARMQQRYAGVQQPFDGMEQPPAVATQPPGWVQRPLPGLQQQFAGVPAWDIYCRKQVLDRILELDRMVFPKEVVEDPARYREMQDVFLPHLAFLRGLFPGCVILLLMFLRRSDLDRFYHNHFRVGEGSLSQQLSHILISEHLQDKVKGVQLIVRLDVKHEDYVRVRTRLGQGLHRTTSVDNLLTLPTRSSHLDHSSLRALDLAVVNGKDQACSGGVDGISSLKFTVKEVQAFARAGKGKSQQVRQLEDKLQVMRGQLHTARQETNDVTEEATRLKEKDEKAQKLVLEQKLELQMLQETNKTSAATMERMKTAEQDTQALVRRLANEAARLKDEDEKAQKTLQEQKLEIQQLQESNKTMKATMEHSKHTAKGQDYGRKEQDPGKMEDPMEFDVRHSARWIVIMVTDDFDDPKEFGPIPLKLCRWLQHRDVQFILLQREHNPNEFIIECALEQDTERKHAALLRKGYKGPVPTGSVKLFEGQRVEVSLLGNVSIAPFSPKPQITFHSQTTNRLQMQVMALKAKDQPRLDGKGGALFFALPRIEVPREKEQHVRAAVTQKGKEAVSEFPKPELLCQLPIHVPYETPNVASEQEANASKGVKKYFYFVKEEVNTDWGDLAIPLGLKWTDIRNIARRNPDDKSCCFDLLCEWQKREGDAATMEVLLKALSEAELQSVVDGLKKEFPDIEVPEQQGDKK